jgi:hypothetical protein
MAQAASDHQTKTAKTLIDAFKADTDRKKIDVNKNNPYGG